MSIQRKLLRGCGLIAFALALMCPATARANLFFSYVPPTPIAAGSSGYVDIMVNSDGSDNLASYLIDFEITGGTGLTFSAAQSNSYFGNSDYVFSALVDPHSTTPSQAVAPSYVDLTIENYSDTFAFVTVDSTSRLLARLELTADAGAASGLYTISFKAGLAGFLTENFDDIGFTPATTQIEVVGASAVPEPSSLALMMCAMGCAGLFMRRKITRQVMGGP